MSFIEQSGARMRRNLVLLAIAGAVLPAQAAAVLPQSQSGSSSSSRSERIAERARREKLLLRLDSLRWEFEHERLSDAERERLKKEMSLAVLALEESLGHVRVPAMYPAEAERAAVAARAWPAPQPAPMPPRTGPRLRGYLGVTFDGPNTRDNDNVIRFYKYPMIALVEPSSPAERAGIRQGDTLVALNGIDVVAREIPLSRMLVPREQLLVKVRREGNAKDLRVTVGEAPEYVMRRMPAPSMAPMPPMGPMGETRVRTAPPGQSSGAVIVTTPGMSPVWVYSDGIGGAKVQTVTEGLGKALGVTSGVLVLSVGTGTMAHESGLRDGDVILRAAGRNVASVRDLRNAIDGDEHHEGVKLVIRRDKRQREVTLRW